MKVSIKTLLFFSSMVILLFAGCGSGSSGGNGSSGANGTNGTNGAQGAQGPAGTNGTNGTSLHVVDANGNDMGILVGEYVNSYDVYNTTANVFFQVLKTSGTVDLGAFSSEYYISSNCTDSGTVYVSSYGYTTNDLIVDNAGNCFSITTTTPGNVGVSSSQSTTNGQQVSCVSYGGTINESVYPANQITCPIPTQYAAPVSVKVE